MKRVEALPAPRSHGILDAPAGRLKVGKEKGNGSRVGKRRVIRHGVTRGGEEKEKGVF